jgi:hypothetical protein
MGNRFSSGKNSIAECDRCGFQFKLRELKKEVIKTKTYDLKVCPQCWDPDQPQLQLGMYPVDDPQGVKDPRPDTTYLVSGLSGLQAVPGIGTNVLQNGENEGGSRVIQWGWNPVGGSELFDSYLTPNNLALTVSIGQVTISTT